MATAKLKTKKIATKKPATKKPALKRAYKRRGSYKYVPPGEPLTPTPVAVDELDDLRVQLLHERAAHAQTRTRLTRTEGFAIQLQHQLDAVRHTVSRTVVLEETGERQTFEFSPIRTRSDWKTSPT